MQVIMGQQIVAMLYSTENQCESTRNGERVTYSCLGVFIVSVVKTLANRSNPPDYSVLNNVTRSVEFSIQTSTQHCEDKIFSKILCAFVRTHIRYVIFYLTEGS